MKAIVITTVNVIENLRLIQERCPGWTPHDANRQICVVQERNPQNHVDIWLSDLRTIGLY